MQRIVYRDMEAQEEEVCCLRERANETSQSILASKKNRKYESESDMWRQGIMICRSIINARAWAWEDPNPTTAVSA